MPSWIHLYVALFAPLTVLTLLAALRWGGRTEIAAATAYVAATVAQKVGEGLFSPMFADFEPVVATIDVALLLWLALLAYRIPKKWILCAAALQLIVCFAHVARVFQPGMPALVYAILMGSAGYPSQMLLAIGIATHRKNAHS